MLIGDGAAAGAGTYAAPGTVAGGLGALTVLNCVRWTTRGSEAPVATGSSPPDLAIRPAAAIPPRKRTVTADATFTLIESLMAWRVGAVPERPVSPG